MRLSPRLVALPVLGAVLTVMVAMLNWGFGVSAASSPLAGTTGPASPATATPRPD
jgi:hypothetical protein